MTAVELQACTRKQLATMAKKGQVNGWHAMRKDELIRALLASRRAKKTSPNRRSGNGHAGSLNGQNGSRLRNGTKTTSPKAKAAAGPASRKSHRRIQPAAIQGEPLRPELQDRLVATVCDPHWILVRWSLSGSILARAEAALGVEWHAAVPVVRVFDVTADDMSTATKTLVRDVEVNGTIDHWYVHVEDSARMYRLSLGYRASSGKFFELAHSDRVRMPLPGAPARRKRSSALDSEPHQNGHARVTRPGMSGPPGGHAWTTAYSSLPLTEAGGLARSREARTADLPFQVEAELVVHGSTRPDAELTLFGERVLLTRDGRFCLRFTLPDGRLVVPAVAIAADGTHQRTVILAIERNTKELAPQAMDEMLSL